MLLFEFFAEVWLSFIGTAECFSDRSKINYIQEQIIQALELACRGEAARQTGVPRNTSVYKKSGKSTEFCSTGPAGSLSISEEGIPVDWILELSKINYLKSKIQLPNNVE